MECEHWQITEHRSAKGGDHRTRRIRRASKVKESEKPGYSTIERVIDPDHCGHAPANTGLKITIVGRTQQ